MKLRGRAGGGSKLSMQVSSFLSLSFQETMGILGGSELSTERRGAYKRKERKREGTSLL